MNLFLKYLLIVLVLLALISSGVAIDIYFKNKLPDFAAEFSPRDLTRIKRFSRSNASLDDSNQYAHNQLAASFGKQLFFDSALSASGEMSCATCHDPKTHWTSRQNQLDRDTPSLWNTANNRWFFWDGRTDNLWSQAMGPIENPKEQASSRTDVLKYISNSTKYRKTYEKLFGKIPEFSDSKRFPTPAKPFEATPLAYKNWQSMTSDDQQLVNSAFANIAKAIAAFEATIIANDSSFDFFLQGIQEKDQSKVDALSPAAQRGLKIFIGKGQCSLCHSGSDLTDREFHFIHLPLEAGQTELAEARLEGVKKVFANPFNSLGEFSDDPQGQRAERLRFLKQDPESIGHYKTPSLRNVEHTAPYMHNGSFKTLREVIDFYSEMENSNQNQPHLEKVVVPLNLSETEKDDLEAFLKSLSSLSKTSETAL